MNTTETVRNGLKLTNEERGWVQCGNPKMCPAMASVPDKGLLRFAEQADPGWLLTCREWLAQELTKFSGPPGMTLRVLDDDEVLSPVDHLAVLLRVPMPNSQDPSQTFPVGRLGYTEAPINYARGYSQASRHDLQVFVYNLMQALALHEVKEWLKYDGEHVVDPHPDN